MMMEGMTCCGPMMWAVIALYVLVVAVLALGAAALIKHLFRGRGK